MSVLAKKDVATVLRNAKCLCGLMGLILLASCKNPVSNSDDSSIIDKNSPFVSGITDDTTARRSKDFTWSCTDKIPEDCEYRFVVNSNSTHSFSDEPYAAVTSTSASSGTGVFYLHIQVRNRLDPLLQSRVFSFSFVLDNTPPQILSLSLPANGSYGPNSPMTFTMHWAEPVYVQGSPRLALTIGSTTRYADYYAGGGSSTLLFRYTPQSGDTDTNGIVFQSQNLDLNGGTVIDGVALPATLSFSGTFGSLAGILVDSTAPTVTGLSNDPVLRPSKVWTWGCSESCTYRFLIDQSPSTNPTGSFSGTTTATQFTGNGTYYIHVQGVDAAGNTSPVVHVSAVVQSVLALALTNPASTVQIVHDNMASFTISGTCSHDAPSSISLSGRFSGSPVLRNCSGNVWSATLNFASVGDSMSTETIAVSYDPGGSGQPLVQNYNFNNCRRTSTFEMMQNGRLLFYWDRNVGGQQTPIWIKGDGSANVQGNFIDYTYTGTAPYTVSVRHCPRDTWRIQYDRDQATNRNFIRGTFTDLLPGGLSEYTTLQTLSLNNNSQLNHGLLGTMPEPNSNPLLTTYGIYHMHGATMPAQFTCPGDLQTVAIHYANRSWATPGMSFPTLSGNCFNTVRQYDVLNAGAAGAPPNFSSFGSQLRIYRIYNNSATYTMPSSLGNATLLTHYENYNNGAGVTGNIPTLSSNTALQWFNVFNNNIEGTLTVNHLANTTQLRSFQVHTNRIGGVMPTISHLSLLQNYMVHGNLLNISTFPTPAGLTQLTDYRIHANAVTGGPYALPNFATNPTLQNLYLGGINFSGSTLSISSLPNTLRFIYFLNTSVNIDNISLAGKNELRELQLRNAGFYTGGNARLNLSGNYPNLYYLLMEGNLMNSARVDEVVLDVYNGIGVNLTSTSASRLIYLQGSNGSVSNDSRARIENLAPYIGNGIKLRGWNTLYNWP